MGFKDFSKQNNYNVNQNYNNSNQDYKEINSDLNFQQQKQQVEQIYEKYKGKNNQELISELLKNVEQQKKNGSFDYQTLCNMVDMFSPYLTQEQKNNMQNLLHKIQ